ncbi:MAG: DUF4136 domain-containing protein [Campylobacterota bacterium]|nr:DUF4136 domain-containing protein [Campylobacterota bacterium]
MKSLLTFWIALLLFTGCSSLKVNTDYDPDISLGGLHTYSIMDPTQKGPDTLQDERIIKAITANLNAKGYRSAAKENADFRVRFRTEVERDVPSNVSFGFGVGSFSGNTGTSVGASRQPLHDKGTLIIDMLSSSDEKILWRGTASDNLRKSDTPHEREAYVQKLVNALLKSFPERAAK